MLSSSSCSGSVAFHLPRLSLITDHHSQFPQFLSSDLLLPYLHCVFLSNQRSLLLNCRPQTIDIHEAGHSGTAPFICTVSKGTKATSHTMEPLPHVLGVREEQFPGFTVEWLLASNDSRGCKQLIILCKHLFWFNVITNLPFVMLVGKKDYTKGKRCLMK